jgi:hypothetical protein
MFGLPKDQRAYMKAPPGTGGGRGNGVHTPISCHFRTALGEQSARQGPHGEI